MRNPSEAEWQRLEGGFSVLFLVTVAVGLGFMFLAPFPKAVALVLVAPPVLATGWIWLVVIRGRDAERLQRLSAFAARRRGPRGGRG
jgi:hypothetical protein